MKKIKFNRIVNFLGRNGLFKAAGIQASITVNPNAETTVWLEPIRQDEGIGRAILQIPVDHIPELVEYLNSVHRQHGRGKLYVEVGGNYIAENGRVFFIEREHMGEISIMVGYCHYENKLFYRNGNPISNHGNGFELRKKIKPLEKIEVKKRYADRFGMVWEVLTIDNTTKNNPYPITAKRIDKNLLEYFNHNGHNPTSYAYQLMYQVGE